MKVFCEMVDYKSSARQLMDDHHDYCSQVNTQEPKVINILFVHPAISVHLPSLPHINYTKKCKNYN